MKKLLNDKLVVVDVEATCWKGKAPEGQHSEIIQIGVCLLDLRTLEIDTPVGRSIIVTPQASAVSEFCTALTGLTQEAVDVGVSFAEACVILEGNYLSLQRAWASWGDYDRRMFLDTCGYRSDVRYPFGHRHVNAKQLHGMLKGLSRDQGMATALDGMGMKMRGRHHDGMWDAVNIAVIIAGLLRQYRSG